MKKVILGIGILFLLNYSIAIGQETGCDNKVSTHIELRKDTLLLGEPAFFEYVINNDSDEPIFVEEGGDYRSGRKISFSVFIISADNDTLKIRELWGAMGGLIGFNEVMPRQSRKFKLFLPMWGGIEKPGKYRLVASKKFRIAPENPFLKEDYSKVQVVPKESTTSFIVIDDNERLGEFIEHLVTEIKNETKGRSTYQSTNERTYEHSRIVAEIADERIVPFLVESFREKKHMERAKVIRLLSKFSSNDIAFETLKYVAQGTENSKCFVSEDSINVVWSSGNIRQTAIQGIVKRNDEKAVEYLTAKKDDGYPCERYVILIRAKLFMSESNRIRIYNAFLSDKNQAVRRKAKEEYEKMKKE